MSKKVSENYNTMIIKALSVKPVAFNPLLAKLSGNACAGLFMSQLLYWWNKGSNDNWIYKTIKEIEEETSLTRSEQDTAIKTWLRLQVLQVKKCGVPPKRHFNIDTDKLFGLLKDVLSVKSTNQFAGNSKSICDNQQHITESTPEITPDTLFNKECERPILEN